MENVHNKLKDYSKAAILILSGVTTTQAGVVYTDISPDTTLNMDGDVYNIDLNNDLIADFRMNVSSGFSYNSVGLENLVSGNVYAATSSTNYVAVLNNGVTVSNAGISYWGSSSGGFNMGFFYTGSSSYNGYWGGESNKYIGTRFLIGGTTHFGWVRVSVQADYSSVTIHDYAYESVANSSILTGAGIPVISNINLEGCDSLNVFGNTYTTSQIVSDTIIGGAVIGVDSITVVNLTINNSTTETIDTTIASGSSIIIDGNNISTPGTYSEVLQTTEGCDSTINYNVSVLQGINNSLINTIKVFPNPATKQLFIDNKEGIIESVRMYNSQGSLSYSSVDLNQNDMISIELDKYPKGVYFLKLSSDQNEVMKKIVIQ